MYQIKRQSSFNETFNIERKKCRKFNENNQSITCIENLSNELFYEIFEYLDGYDIYKTFSNLNFRIQHLITCSSLPLRIKCPYYSTSQLIDCCKNVIYPNRHRILSLDFEYEFLINDFFNHSIINSSFNRLQSVVFKRISINRAVIILFYLNSLPNLFSLTMSIVQNGISDLSDIYRMILSLPFLKYNKLSLFSANGYEDEDEYRKISLPFALNEQFSSIEYMVINHRCTLSELMYILSHTSRLRYLICDHLEGREFYVIDEQLLTLSNLVYIHIKRSHIDFDNFEIFLKKVSSQLEILRIGQYIGNAYLDADRWKQLIKMYIPKLHTFIYEYSGYNYNVFKDIFFHRTINQFISSFWIDKGWIFQLKIYNNKEIGFSIHPYKKTWFDIEEHTKNVIHKKLLISQLSIKNYSFNQLNETFINCLKYLFVAVHFTHLDINCENIPIDILIRIIQLLPNLDSLKISSLPINQYDWLFDIDTEMFFQTSTNNKIRKVHLENMIDIEQINFLFCLCRSIEYFQVDCEKDINIKILLRYILIKINIDIPNLICLYLNVKNCSDEMVHTLQKLIDDEKRLDKYTIKRIYNNIILKWN